MKQIMQVILCIGALGCGGSSSSGHNSHSNNAAYAEAGIAAGIAVTAAIIKAARGKAKPIQKVDQCCAICDKCSFPCGDTCLTTGNICFKPDGCACYDSQLPPEHRPPESDLPCGPAPDGNGNAPAVIPMGVAF